MADGNAPYSGPDYSHPVEYENTMQPTNKISSLQPSTIAGQFQIQKHISSEAGIKQGGNFLSEMLF
jgi:hypothetical protein